MSKALEAAAWELVKYNTIPELYEQEWPSCVNPARAAILAFLREANADDIGCELVGDHDERAAISKGELASEVLAALTRLAEGPAP